MEAPVEAEFLRESHLDDGEGGGGDDPTDEAAGVQAQLQHQQHRHRHHPPSGPLLDRDQCQGSHDEQGTTSGKEFQK